MEKYPGEFFVTLDGRIFLDSGSRMIHVTEDDTDIYCREMEYVKSRHNEEYKTLYSLHDGNLWLMFVNHINCNCAILDHVPDVDSSGIRHYEKQPCPARFGMKCPYNNIICSPKFTTNLSKKETQVLALLIENKTDLEIADALYISTETVKSHRHNILDKLNLKNKADIIDFAHKNDLK